MSTRDPNFITGPDGDVRSTLKSDESLLIIPDDLVATRYQFKEDIQLHMLAGVSIEAVVSLSYKGVRWAVRKRGACLSSKTGKWVLEPRPSERSDRFYRDFRFLTFEAALIAARKARTEG